MTCLWKQIIGTLYLFPAPFFLLLPPPSLLFTCQCDLPSLTLFIKIIFIPSLFPPFNISPLLCLLDFLLFFRLFPFCLYLSLKCFKRFCALILYRSSDQFFVLIKSLFLVCILRHFYSHSLEWMIQCHKDVYNNSRIGL